MEEFLALIESLRNPGEEGTPPGIYDDLSQRYTDDLSTRDAKMGELNEKIAFLESEVSRLKIHNYDLMTSIPAGDPDPDGDPEPSSDDDSDIVTDDDLFGEDD